MDTSILYAILIGLCFVGLVILYSFLKRKYNIKDEDLLKDVDMLKMVVDTGISVAKTMNFGDKETLDKLRLILIDVFEYVKVITNEDRDEIISDAIIKTKELCLSFNIKLDEERENIIETIITMSYNLYESIEKTK